MHVLGHLSIRLLWCLHSSFPYFLRLPVLIVTSQLFRSTIDQMQEVWVQLRLSWHFLSFFHDCVVFQICSSNWHVFNSVAALMFLQQETRPYVSGFPLRCCDHSYTAVITFAMCITVSQQPNGKRPLFSKLSRHQPANLSWMTAVNFLERNSACSRALHQLELGSSLRLICIIVIVWRRDSNYLYLKWWLK